MTVKNTSPTRPLQAGDTVTALGPNGEPSPTLIGTIEHRLADEPMMFRVRFRDDAGVPYFVSYNELSLALWEPAVRRRKKVWPWVVGGSLVAFALVCGAVGAAAGDTGGAVRPAETSGSVSAHSPAPTPFTVPESAPSASPSVDAAPAPDDVDAIFRATLENAGIPARAIPAAKNVAGEFCKALDSGLAFDTTARLYLSQATGSGVTPAQLGSVIGAGVESYCPTYDADLEAFVAANR